MDETTSERFYRLLLALNAAPRPEPIVSDALKLLIALAGARFGYVEMFADEHRGQHPFVLSHCVQTAASAERACVEIIRAALDGRETINVASAVQHPRFRTSAFVQAHSIRAVMCMPIGVGAPEGVLYVEGRELPGRFPDVERERAELFAAELAPIADRIRDGARRDTPTLDDEVERLEQRVVRTWLDRNSGNVSGTARALGITRSRLYRILKRA